MKRLLYKTTSKRQLSMLLILCIALCNCAPVRAKTQIITKKNMRTKYTIGVGETVRMDFPTKLKTSSYKWESKNEAIAKVHGKKPSVTGVHSGKTKIICYTTMKMVLIIPPLSRTDSSAATTETNTNDNTVAPAQNTTVSADANSASANPSTIPPGCTTQTKTIKQVVFTYNITVKKAPKKIQLSSTEVSLFAGETDQITLKTNKKSVCNRFTFQTSNPKIATIKSDGTITAKKPGTCTLTVSTYNKKKASCKVHVKDPSKAIALSFDDGPSQYTNRVVSALKKYDYNATFFMVGQYVQGQKNLQKEILKNGNEIGIHSWSHSYFAKLSQEQATADIKRSQNLTKKYTGVTPTLFRPPYGSYNDSTIQAIKATGCSCILWNIDVQDWKTTDSNLVLSNIMKQTHSGSVLVLHDSHESSVNAIISALPQLKKKGYEVVTISKLAQLRHTSLKPGTKFYGTAK